MQTKLKGLEQFLEKANKNSYANKSAPKSTSLRPSSEDYHFEDGDFVYHDTYFGGRDFIGEEIVYKNDKPVWGMNYHGFILSSKISERNVYDFLREALTQESMGILPVRGPKEYKTEDKIYTNTANGELDRFSGVEEVSFNNEPVYRCWYHGGVVQ